MATTTCSSSMTGGDAPRYSRAQVDHCAFAAWYPVFKSVAVKGAVIPLPPAVVALLLADGAALPSTSATHSQALADVRVAVDAVLARFGGRAFPKLNWTSPRDASWMLGSMQCSSFEDVMLLLQSSDFAVHDMTAAYTGCEKEEEEKEREGEEEEEEEVAAAAVETETTEVVESKSSPDHPNGPENVYLVLKKWCNLYDSMLFRCFVVNHTLVGISQRNCDEFYPFLFDQQDHLCELIYSFFDTHFRERSGRRRRSSKFPDPDYIFDVYVDKQNRVFLLDINVFGAVTDPLMFSWEELLELQAANLQSSARAGAGNANGDDSDDADDGIQDVVDFRIVESELSIRPNPLSGYRVPTDLVDHLAGGAGFEAFMDQVKRDNAQANDSESSDDTEQEQDDEDDDDGVLWGSDNDD